MGSQGDVRGSGRERADICNIHSMFHLIRTEDYMDKHHDAGARSTKGSGTHVPSDHFVTCEECGKRVPESEAVELEGYHLVCSTRCGLLWWGVEESDIAGVLPDRPAGGP